MAYGLKACSCHPLRPHSTKSLYDWCNVNTIDVLFFVVYIIKFIIFLSFKLMYTTKLFLQTWSTHIKKKYVYILQSLPIYKEKYILYENNVLGNVQNMSNTCLRTCYFKLFRLKEWNQKCYSLQKFELKHDSSRFKKRLSINASYINFRCTHAHNPRRKLRLRIWHYT